MYTKSEFDIGILIILDECYCIYKYFEVGLANLLLVFHSLDFCLFFRPTSGVKGIKASSWPNHILVVLCTAEGPTFIAIMNQYTFPHLWENIAHVLSIN